MMGSGVRVSPSALARLGVGDARLGLRDERRGVVELHERQRLRGQSRVEVLLRRVDRRRAVRAHLPERLERRVAPDARPAEGRRAHWAREVVGLDPGAADRALRPRLRELPLEGTHLDPPGAHVVEGLGGAEEEIDHRPDVRRHEPEQGRQDYEKRVADPPPRVLVDPEPEGKPEDHGEQEREVPGDYEAGRVDEAVDAMGMPPPARAETLPAAVSSTMAGQWQATSVVTEEGPTGAESRAGTSSSSSGSSRSATRG